MRRWISRSITVVSSAMLIAGGVTVVASATPADPTVAISLAEDARTRNGNALLQVTYTCTIPPEALSTWYAADLYVTEMTQPLGRHDEVFGIKYTSGYVCDGTPHRRTVTVTPWSAAGFGGGKATVTVAATVCWWSESAGSTVCATDSIERATVRLRGGGSMPSTSAEGSFPVSVAPTGRVSHGVASLNVLYACTVPAIADQYSGEVSVILRQPSGRARSAQGAFSFWDLVCDGATHRVTVAVASYTAARFSAGMVTVTVYANLYWDDLDDCESYGDDCVIGYLDGTLEGATVVLRP